MKKYIAAGGVAVVAFAFAASAAQLQVTAEPLQVGEDGVSCADEAVVYAWGYNDHLTPATVGEAAIALLGNDCDPGQNLTVTLLDGNNGVLGRFNHEVVAGEDQGRVQFGSPGVEVEAIETVRIALEQGPTVGTWADSRLND